MNKVQNVTFGYIVLNQGLILMIKRPRRNYWSRRLNCYSYIVSVDFIVFFAYKEQYITIISKPLNIFLSKYSKLTLRDDVVILLTYKKFVLTIIKL